MLHLTVKIGLREMGIREFICCVCSGVFIGSFIATITYAAQNCKTGVASLIVTIIAAVISIICYFYKI